MNATKRTITIATAAILTGCLFAGAAQAAPPPVGDVFNRVPDTAATGTTNGAKPNSVASDWFKAFDTAVNSHKKNQTDATILSRPFNQEAERVSEWTATATKVSKNYRELAK